MADDVQNRHAGPFAFFGGLIVQGPRDDDCDSGEESCGGRVDAYVLDNYLGANGEASMEVACESDKEIGEGRKEGVGDYEGAS